MDFQAEVLAKKNLTDKIIELDLRLVQPASINFKAGQFVQLHVKDKIKRAYSIVSAPNTPSPLIFCINMSPMGPGSQYIETLKAGDMVTIDGPHGIMTVKNFDKDQLFIAAGTGVAPFKSIISDLLQNGFAKKIALVFGVRNEQESFYFDFFEELARKYPNFKFVPCLSQPSAEWQGFSGRITKYVDENFEQYEDFVVYICGGPPVIKDVRAILIGKGVPPLSIKLEIFT